MIVEKEKASAAAAARTISHHSDFDRTADDLIAMSQLQRGRASVAALLSTSRRLWESDNDMSSCREEVG